MNVIFCYIFITNTSLSLQSLHRTIGYRVGPRRPQRLSKLPAEPLTSYDSEKVKTKKHTERNIPTELSFFPNISLFIISMEKVGFQSYTLIFSSAYVFSITTLHTKTHIYLIYAKISNLSPKNIYDQTFIANGPLKELKGAAWSRTTNMNSLW